MNTPAHDWHRLHYTGLRGHERADLAERRYQRIMCVLLTLALIGALCLCQAA